MSIRIVTDMHDDDRPLCPQVLSGPLDPLHAERVRMLDAFANAAEKDNEGEFAVPAVAEAFGKAAYDGKDRMSLYSLTVLRWDL
jgi:hypothetical protein